MTLQALSRTTNTKDKVLQAATRLFAAKGFRGTSVRDIAVRAKVNEVTIFRLFGSKKALYLSVLRGKIGPNLPPWMDPALKSSQDEGAFNAVAAGLQNLFDPLFTRLLFFAALERPDVARKSIRPRLEEFYKVFGGYIEEQINNGNLRPIDPLLTARALVGLVFYERIFNDLLRGRHLPEREYQQHVKSYVDIWLRGVQRQMPS